MVITGAQWRIDRRTMERRDAIMLSEWGKFWFQQIHITAGHIICALVKESLFPRRTGW
jgi:hypothetical protein